MSRQTRLAKRQSRAQSRIARIQQRYNLLPSSVTVPTSVLPEVSTTSPITAVMDQPIMTDPMAIPNIDMATRYPKITRQQLRYEKRRLKRLPREIKKLNKLNMLREQQEFLLNQQMEQAPDYSVVRDAPRYGGPSRSGSEGASYFDPMQAGPPPGPGSYAPGSWGPPMNYFSPQSFQPPASMPSGNYMLPPSQSGVPGGLIYSYIPPEVDQWDLSNEPIFEEDNEEFGEYMDYSANFASMEPLDSYGAVTGEPAQASFFDKLSGFVSQAGNRYADLEAAKTQARYAARRAPAPASSQMKTSGSLDQRSVLAMGAVLLGGLLIIQALRPN